MEIMLWYFYLTSSKHNKTAISRLANFQKEAY